MAKQPIGEFLATQRKAKGYTQQQVADELGISNRTLSAWEQGHAYPDILSLPALAELYGVTADEILAGERKTANNPEQISEEISEKSRAKLYKQKLARAKSKNILLCGIGCGIISLIIIAAIIGNYVPVELTGALGAVAALIYITVMILFAVFHTNTMASAGIFTDEEHTPQECKFIKSLYRHTLKAWLAQGIVWTAVGAFVTLLPILWADDVVYNTVIETLGVFTLLFGIVTLMIALIVKLKTRKRYNNNETA